MRVQAFLKTDIRAREYIEASRSATVKAYREAAKLVARVGRRYAPRSLKHRVVRKYPSGWTGPDAKRISQSIIQRVRSRKDRGVLAIVRSKVGYSVWQEHGWQPKDRTGRPIGPKQPARYFLRRALHDNLDKVIDILKKRWPK